MSVFQEIEQSKMRDSEFLSDKSVWSTDRSEVPCDAQDVMGKYKTNCKPYIFFRDAFFGFLLFFQTATVSLDTGDYLSKCSEFPNGPGPFRFQKISGPMYEKASCS